MKENKAALSVFAKKLRELRGEESQASFSSQICVHPIQYSKYERGLNSPSIDVLMKICLVNGCSADWLLGLPVKSYSQFTVLRSGNAVGNGATVNTLTIAAPGESSNCRKCPYKEAVKKLQKAGLQLPGLK